VHLPAATGGPRTQRLSLPQTVSLRAARLHTAHCALCTAQLCTRKRAATNKAAGDGPTNWQRRPLLSSMRVSPGGSRAANGGQKMPTNWRAAAEQPASGPPDRVGSIVVAGGGLGAAPLVRIGRQEPQRDTRRPPLAAMVRKFGQTRAPRSARSAGRPLMRPPARRPIDFNRFCARPPQRLPPLVRRPTLVRSSSAARPPAVHSRRVRGRPSGPSGAPEIELGDACLSAGR